MRETEEIQSKYDEFKETSRRRQAEVEDKLKRALKNHESLWSAASNSRRQQRAREEALKKNIAALQRQLKKEQNEHQMSIWRLQVSNRKLEKLENKMRVLQEFAFHNKFSNQTYQVLLQL